MPVFLEGTSIERGHNQITSQVDVRESDDPFEVG